MKALLSDALPDVRVHVLESNDDIAACCREFRSAGASCVAAAGGDGTIRSVASSVIDLQVPLGVIPGGTLNHFARDVGVGRNVPEAVEILRTGKPALVDVATVNGQVFLNNSSIGMYPEMVYLREADEYRLGKWRAMVRAVLLVIRKARWTGVEIRTDGEVDAVRTRLLFVGNNQYELRLLRLGRRERLDGGTLCCYVLDAPNRIRMTQTALGSLRTDRRERRFFRSLQTSELTVEPSQEDEVQVAADGEVFEMKMPLVYRVRPRALQVIVP
jgi:diacylglycerol kinase family enzyme